MIFWTLEPFYKILSTLLSSGGILCWKVLYCNYFPKLSFFYPSHVSFIPEHSFSTLLPWFTSLRETEREKSRWMGRVLWLKVVDKAAAWLRMEEKCLPWVPAHLHWEPYSEVRDAEQWPSAFKHAWINYSNSAWPLSCQHSHRPLHSSNTYLGAHTVLSGSVERVFTSRLMMITRLTWK